MSLICGFCAFEEHGQCDGLLRGMQDVCACAERGHVPVPKTEEQLRIEELNEAIYLRAVTNFFKRTEAR